MSAAIQHALSDAQETLQASLTTFHGEPPAEVLEALQAVKVALPAVRVHRSDAHEKTTTAIEKLRVAFEVVRRAEGAR